MLKRFKLLSVLCTASVFLISYKLLLALSIVFTVFAILLSTILLWFSSILAFVFLQIFPFHWLQPLTAFMENQGIEVASFLISVLGALLIARWFWRKHAQHIKLNGVSIFLILVGVIMLFVKVNGM